MSHTLVPAVPSLFTFNIQNELIKGLEGISILNPNIKILNSKIETEGPVLITHWGLSGPAILKVSAVAAIELAAMNYKFSISVNWLNKLKDVVKEILAATKLKHSKKNIGNYSPFDLAKRFWNNVLSVLKIDPAKNYADITKEDIDRLSQTLTNCILEVNGKSTNKEEFVTAGGILLKEVDFKTMESKLVKDLYFAGEVLDIDAVTGGFNFQAAWTTGYIAGHSISEK